MHCLLYLLTHHCCLMSASDFNSLHAHPLRHIYMRQLLPSVFDKVSESLLSAAAVLRPASPPIYEAQPASWAVHVTKPQEDLQFHMLLQHAQTLPPVCVPSAFHVQPQVMLHGLGWPWILRAYAQQIEVQLSNSVCSLPT